jgi:hypothetical protein
MADTPAPTLSTAPLPRVPGPTSVAWREQALARATELRGRLRELCAHRQLHVANADVVEQIELHLAAAEEAASNRRADGGKVGVGTRIVAAWRGAAVERSDSELDAAESTLLRIAPPSYVIGQLPALLARARTHLPASDPRFLRLCRLADVYASTDVEGHEPRLREEDREAVVAALRAATLEERRAIARIRSFRNILLAAAAALTLCVVGVMVVGTSQPRVMPLCFTPDSAVVCPTHSAQTRVPTDATASVQAAESARTLRLTVASWDVVVVLLLGLLGAAVAAAAALRNAEGTSTPYSLPMALALLKLPTGALTAFLGIMLMRGQFVPGLSALDTSAQIAAWAIVFGYAQQIFTKLVDGQAAGVANQVGTVDNAKAGEVTIPTDVPAPPTGASR